MYFTGEVWKVLEVCSLVGDSGQISEDQNADSNAVSEDQTP